MNHRGLSSTPNPAKRQVDPAEEVLVAMIRDNARDLYRYAYWLCLHPARAEHLLIESFARVPASLFESGDVSPGRWQLYSLVRRKHGPPDTSLSREGRQRPELAADVPAGSSGDSHRLREQIQQLPDQQREALVLQALDFSVLEIAQIISASPRSVTSHLRHARVRVAQALR